MSERLAIYVRDLNKLEDEARDAFGLWAGAGAMRAQYLAENAPLIGLPYARDRIGSIFEPPGPVERIFVSPSLRLFVNPWGAAFLTSLNQSLTSDGSLAVPFSDDPGAAENGYWTLAALEQLFSSSAKVNEGFALFDRAEKLKQMDSVLTWYLGAHDSLVVDSLLLKAGVLGPIEAGDLPDICGDWLLDPEPSDTQVGRSSAAPLSTGLPEGPDLDASELLNDAFQSQRYWFSGLNYKSALVSHILRSRLPRPTGARTVDLGGGPGWLSQELLLDHRLQLGHATSVDHSTHYPVLAWRLLEEYRDRLEGRFSFAQSPIEEFRFDSSCDAVIAVGSLLYVPRDRLPRVLEGAWNALNEGGLLIIHENMRAPSYTKDQSIMFEPEELDGYLSEFGTVSHYLPTATTQVSQQDAGRKSVFRVVQKNQRT